MSRICYKTLSKAIRILLCILSPFDEKKYLNKQFEEHNKVGNSFLEINTRRQRNLFELWYIVYYCSPACL